VPAGIAIAAVLGGGAWLWIGRARVHWARYEALPEIVRLAAKEDYGAAFDLVERARPYLPGDAELERLGNTVSFTATVRTEPAGADVSIREYARTEGAWRELGRSPITTKLPFGYYRWRSIRPGREASEAAGFAFPEMVLRSGSAQDAPPGMVYVPGGQREIAGRAVRYDAFWLDTFEVTNRRFKAFVDAGGYRKREYWRQAFLKDGRELPWDEALRTFVDKTGRPGPAPWELGNYAQGEADYPVRGVSWFEAAAFAEFEGKSLPTAYHWLRATDSYSPPAVVELSNFKGRGPAPAGSHQGLGPFGTYDMAGNVREWAWNATGDKRSTLGGAWNEPVYTYNARHAASPFERGETLGFRLARYEKPLEPELLLPIERNWRDYAREKPVDDKTFSIYAGLYRYDKAPLDAKGANITSGSPHWRQERIEYAAAYGGERIPADLYLPLNAKPPFQTVVYFPGSSAQVLKGIETWDRQFLDFVIQSGRAVLYPVYKGTYERALRPMPAHRSTAYRDLVIQDYKDLARSVDYLETRQDVDAAKLAYYGFSWGAREGITFTALEHRFKASVLLAGGLDNATFLPEIDQLNFVSRVTLPTLVLNGRDDFRFPLEESQRPLFRLLGSKEKAHTLIPGGHIPPRLEVIKATLDWLDRWLGPVETKN
jgi:dienelactone hydrolase